MAQFFQIINLFLLVIMLNMIIVPSHSAPVQFVNISINMDKLQLQLTNRVINHKLIQLNDSEHELIKANDDSSNDSDGFLTIFGIHTHKNRNVSLCRWQNPKSIVMNGTNFGLAFGRNQHYHRSYSICLYNPNVNPLNVLLIENKYHSIYGMYNFFHIDIDKCIVFHTVPVPGGCNLEFPLEISPFIYIKPTTFPLINYLTFQHAAFGNETDWKYQCGRESRDQIEYLIYAYYTNDNNDNDDETGYFHRLISMSIYDWIVNHCLLIARINSNLSPLRLYFASNSKQTIYFNIVARLKNEAILNDTIHWSLYIPSHNTNTDSKSVDIVFIIVLVFMGIFSTIVSIIGYRYFILGIFFTLMFKFNL